MEKDKNREFSRIIRITRIKYFPQ